MEPVISLPSMILFGLVTDLTKEISYDVIYVMRTSLLKEDDIDLWKHRRAVPITEVKLEHVSSHLPKMQKVSDESMHDENHARIFASMVPDEVIYNINDYSKRYYDVCLLFGDVSGFTDLCEKYNKTGKGGPSRLTQVLNNYIGAMVQEILSHGGDVLKFSGDAFLAMWKVTDNLSMKDAVHEALDCSLIIQKTYGRYQADVDVIIRVKLAVSAGHVVYCLIGDQTHSHYFLFGTPITDLKAAESHSFAGDIIITRGAWQHVNSNEYLAEELPDGLHAKVFGVGPNWRSTQRNLYNKDDTYSVLTANKRISPTSSENSLFEEDNSESSSDEYSLARDSGINQVYTAGDQYALRPAVNFAVRFRMKEDLKKFILPPVERGIIADEPIEYLTEIRQVTVLFINCKVSYEVDPGIGLDMANTVYLAVNAIVTPQQGCVNKINLFDKDLMLLVIFGLRGLKHELECQTALKCATECLQTLNNMDNVIGVSVGVTTGKTYCGAFGHTLRREYTVISLTVNKAARIMVAYPNKVTCDRETFLHSKLEPRNFILQEYKHLKGIANPGPIYEFKEIERIRKVSAAVCARPLLGREQEIDLYIQLLNLATGSYDNESDDQKCFTMMLIQGESRQGKTRLLEEMVYCTDIGTPFVRFNLTKTDLETPYATVRLIIYDLLRISEETTKNEIKAKVIRRLKKYDLSPADYYLLNDVLNVDFEVPDNLSPVTRTKHLKQCFIKYWVIVIDDSEYIDQESWLFITTLINLNCCFIVATMGLRSFISHMAMEVLKEERVKVVQMKSVDKWFHAGLACQMLDVEAIPPELEKVIQNRSNGNPGWVESFLISLVQSGGLFLKEIIRKSAYDTGLIIPPLYMMIRLTQEEINLWVQIMEEGTSLADESTRWKMYVDSCRESYPDLTIAQSLREKFDLYSPIKVCILNPNFNIDDVDPELSMDVLILKIFDSLTSYQQLLLKCSAILGSTFPRAMLMYIMSTSAVRITALAVKKLFEIHVLTCAKGDFLDGGVIFKERLKNPNEDWDVRCECKGLIIDEICEDLPKYACCGYMRFRSSTFRETTYNLLTDNQKREFHSKAIRYLEKETRRCRTCGNGYFCRYTGIFLDMDLRQLKTKKKKASISSAVDSTSVAALDDLDKSRQSLLSLTRASDLSKTPKESLRVTASFGWVTPSSTSDDTCTIDSRLTNVDSFGLRIVKNCQNDYNLTRTFSDVDFSQCTCLLILNTMYHQLVEHCNGAGHLMKMVDVLIEHAYICIEYQNVPQAFKVLKDALATLDVPTIILVYRQEWKIQLKRGKVRTVEATGWLKLRQWDKCLTNLMIALNHYEVSFPKTYLGRKLLRPFVRGQVLFGLFGLPNLFHGQKADDTMLEYWNDVAECFTVLSEYYMLLNQWPEAELAASYALRYAVASASDFYRVSTSFCAMLHIGNHYGYHYTNVALEVFAFKMCNRKRSLVEPLEFKSVARLYAAIFFSRILRSEIDKAIHIGYLLWRISVSTRLMFIVLTMLPMLIQLVLFKTHIIESGNMIREIITCSHEDMDNSAKSWFYGMCLSYHLETGLIVEPYAKCLAFLQTEGQEPILRDPEGKRRLITATWLWNVRNSNWEHAFIWQEAAWSYDIGKTGETIESICTGVYLLEGMIVYMVGKMDRKNIKAADYARKNITKLFSTLFDASKKNKIILPRLYHLKAYFQVAYHNDYASAIKLLKKATMLAKKYGNELEESWIEHSRQAWCNKLPKTEKIFWRQHAEEDYILYIDFDEISDRLGHYSLPVPLLL